MQQVTTRKHSLEVALTTIAQTTRQIANQPTMRHFKWQVSCVCFVLFSRSCIQQGCQPGHMTQSKGQNLQCNHGQGHDLQNQGQRQQVAAVLTVTARIAAATYQTTHAGYSLYFTVGWEMLPKYKKYMVSYRANPRSYPQTVGLVQSVLPLV